MLACYSPVGTLGKGAAKPVGGLAIESQTDAADAIRSLVQVVGAFVVMAFTEKDVIRDKRKGIKSD